MADSTSIIDFTHEEFIRGIKRIAAYVKASDFEPDYIVGIVRGGAVPAVYLSHSLKLPVQMVHWSTRDKTDFGNETNAWIPEDIRDGKKILLVDDIIDGGDTIRELLADWQSCIRDPLPLENIKIASLVYNEESGVDVDFYDIKIKRSEEPRWFVFDWE